MPNKPTKAPPKHKPKLSAAGTVEFRGMEDESLLIPLSGLSAVQRADGPGNCARCNKSYRRGDWLFRDAGELVAVNCCATREDVRDESEPVPLGAEYFEDEGALAQVLPTGRTKADMCRICFQIPASNGVCGC
jgi:hypothetical protein